MKCIQNSLSGPRLNTEQQKHDKLTYRSTSNSTQK